MSMTSNPASEFQTAFAQAADYLARGQHEGEAHHQFGAFFDVDGKRYSCYYSEAAHKCSCNKHDGQASPTAVFEKFETWAGRPGADHFGHPLTHIGSVAAPKGSMEIWFCQKDKEICYDSIT